MVFLSLIMTKYCHLKMKTGDHPRLDPNSIHSWKWDCGKYGRLKDAGNEQAYNAQPIPLHLNH